MNSNWTRLQVEHDRRDVTDGMRTPWKLPVDIASKSFQELIRVANLVIGLSEEIRVFSVMRL